jgi:S-DNA-T family DNA segregation ATPase FtsK/SpoIIIE
VIKMNWLTKLVSFLSGDDLKDDEQKDDVLPESTNNIPRNVLNNPSTEGAQSGANQIAEARISYQYPKGNFKFPMIPDEKQTFRDERPRQPSRTYDKKKQSGNIASFTNHTNNRTRDERLKNDDEKPKRPFQLTAIPSPVFGFQSREKSSLKIHQPKDKIYSVNDQYIPTGEKAKLSDFVVNDIQQDHGAEKNSTNDYVDDRQIEKEEQKMSIESSYTIDELDSIESKGHLDIVEMAEEEELQINEEIRIVNEQVTDMAEYEEHPEIIILNNDEELAVEDNEAIEKVHIDLSEHKERIYHLEESNLEKIEPIDQTDYEIDLVDKTVEKSNDKLPILQTNSPTDHHSGDRHQDEQTDERKKQINHQSTAKSSHPFNVLMFGRDKQSIPARKDSYQFPSLSYLNVPENELVEDQAWLNEQKELLDVTLSNFNVRASVVNVTQGPSVTRFEVHPEPGVKVNKITNLSDDIKLSLAAKDIRIEAPIPGKNTIGIEVPNKISKTVYLREILRSKEFRENPSPMTAVLGLDIAGQPAVTDLKKMPHGLIAGATGSGKSVCINTILVSLLYKSTPHEVKLMLIDPKMVELAPYNDIPHLVSPVITDVKAATAALKWAVEEMDRRYELFAHSGTREITRYNQLVKEHKQGEHLPYLVIIIDELADLMMVAPSDVEEAICRIAQKARACGIHLIVATQRPSVDVITGLIKANIPTRIAFSVSSQVDSRTIIDVNGAEKLLGRGDMLFLENGSSKAVRLQGSFVTDDEIDRVVKHVKRQSKPNYLFHQDELVKKANIQAEEDELFLEACEFVVQQGGASTSLLQRHFRIGYNRAARLIDMMEIQGIISENKGSKPRDILISEDQLESLYESSAN